MVPPADFIPAAEDTGLIVEIGRWVLEQACRHARSWHERFPRHDPVDVSVNLSPRQFQHAEIVDEVFQILRATRLDPTCLVLEITEGVVMRDVEAAIKKLQALRALGVRVAIDDFGTGTRRSATSDVSPSTS
jgi:EAL domain-containing protein (putative c-di-GMP-specific phosphodiesterase class I)